jgi:hypothetical protein
MKRTPKWNVGGLHGCGNAEEKVVIGGGIPPSMSGGGPNKFNRAADRSTAFVGFAGDCVSLFLSIGS